MKVALVGNQNNNNFSILRYFRDLGVDAHLLVCKNEGFGQTAHFRPEADTWNIEKWRPFIKHIDIVDDPFTVVGRTEYVLPITRYFGFIKSRLNVMSGKQDYGWCPTEGRRIHDLLIGYDHYIASGIMPAIFDRGDINLDIFFPYSSGIEHFGCPLTNRKMNSFNPLLVLSTKKVRLLQGSGIKKSRAVICSDLAAETVDSFNRIQKTYHKMLAPIVYNAETPILKNYSPMLRKTLDVINKTKFVIFCWSRQVWRKPCDMSVESWELENKNSDWLFRALKIFLEKKKSVDVKLIVTEYGTDVESSKNLCGNLGINPNVIWIPKMPRREIYILIEHASVCVGEFHQKMGTSYGGTTWESLSGGKVLINGETLQKKQYFDHFSHEQPPVLGINKWEQMVDHLVRLCDSVEERSELERRARCWFESNHGIKLANRWLKILSDSHP